jgi:ketosteroid isomerase-like protein
VTDGPFAETKELIAGFWIWNVQSKEEAIEWVKKCPNPMPGTESEIEIRQIFEAEDFGAEFTPELREQEDAIRAMSENKGEAEIRRLIGRWSKALEAKDLDGLTVDYAPNAVLFDAIPPYKAEGVDAIRKIWKYCLPHMPEIKSVHRDLIFHVAGDMAVFHGLHNFETDAPHPCSQSWIRITVCYRRIDGLWKVVHEHASVPFNPMDNQAWEIADPDSLTMPDYGQPPSE